MKQFHRNTTKKYRKLQISYKQDRNMKNNETTEEIKPNKQS